MRRLFGALVVISLGYPTLGKGRAEGPGSAQLGPIVAKAEMQLTLGEKILDSIQKGDLLNVLEEREDRWVIKTFNGVKGVVEKVNAVPISEAADVYTEMIRETPKEGRLYTLRAASWLAQGKGENALADFDRAIEMGYDSPHAYSSRGLFHAAMGAYEKAVADHTTAIEKGPSDSVAYLNRAAARMSLNQIDLAIADYGKAIELDAKNAVLHQQRAVAFKVAGKLEEAIADFNQALVLDPKNIPAMMGRGFLRFQRKEHQLAVDDFAQVIQLSPQSAIALNNRGYNLAQLGKYAEALADYDRAIAVAGDYGLAHQNRAWLLATCENKSLRNSKEAIAAGEKACELSEYKNLSDVAALAAAFASADDFDRAIGWQEKVVEAVAEEQKADAQRVLELYRTKQPFSPPDKGK
jgi:tetratricopeptide (TPR) repeat protein